MVWVQKRRVCAPGAAAVLVVMFLAALGGAAPVGAQFNSAPAASDAISLDVVDADLSQVVRILMSDSKQSIIIADPDAKQKRVTAMLNGVPLETALKYVVQSVGCSWQRQPDGVYIIGGKMEAQPSLPPSASAAPEPGVPLVDGSFAAHGRLSALDDHEARRDTKVETIKLYNTRPLDMMWILGLYNRDDAARIEAAVVKPGVFVQRPDGSLTPMFVPSQPTPPMTESLKSDSSYAQRAAGPGAEAAQYPPTPPGFAGGPGRGVVPGVTGRAVQPGQAGAAPGTQQGAGLLPAGVEYAMPYELDNSLIVRGTDEGISELKTIISMLDVAPKQIWIRAMFVTVSTSELDSLGINWAVDRMSTSFSTNFNPAGNVIIGYASGNVMANLRAQLTKSKGSLTNAPIVTTMNNVPARIGFETQVPYLNSTTVYGATGTPTTSSWVDTYAVTSLLEVLPRVNSANNSITVEVRPQLSDIEKFVSTGDMQLPIVNSQWIETTRRVNDGETIVLGGLIRKNTSETVDKIPLLGDLPIIGPLFRVTNRNTDDKELLIFLTPKIVPEAPVAGTGIGVIP
ncbi:MAG TPA: hypothetical protein VMX94_04085 [Armatimonadota bacterium]|nr:hypothetical protein [Armatimonadota bacterium]